MTFARAITVAAVAAASMVQLQPAAASSHPPAPVIDSPTQDAMFGHERVRFHGTAQDAASVAAAAYGRHLGTFPVADGRWSFEAIFPEASVEVNVWALDAGGRYSIESDSVYFVVDLTGPALEIRSPSDRNIVSSPASMSVYAFERWGVEQLLVRAENVATGERYAFEASCEEPCQSSYASSWSVSVAVPTGLYRIGASARDLAGNYGSARAITVLIL